MIEPSVEVCSELLLRYIYTHTQDCQHLPDTEGFLNFTPGVNYVGEGSGDVFGQQYRTPEAALRGGTDVLIIGRCIYEADDPAEEAKKFQTIAWKAYSKMIV